MKCDRYGCWIRCDVRMLWGWVRYGAKAGCAVQVCRGKEDKVIGNKGVVCKRVRVGRIMGGGK